MKTHKLFVSTFFLLVPILIFAQGVKYTTSWLGSTTGTTPWMENFINYIQVDPDGTVYTSCGWDEGSGGARKGTFKDGNILANHSRNINFKQLTDNEGKTWTIQDPPGDIYPTGNDTIKCSDGRTITDVDGPTGMALSNDGKLMVSEFGLNGQVRFYDITGTGTPVLDRTFGAGKGFLSGTPGTIGDLRFREMTGTGMDQEGNIYVSMSSFYGGCKLQSYTPEGKKNWELNGLMFVDNGDFDPTTDGKDIYTKSHHFVMDYSRPAGQQWTDTAYTLNRFKYPDDARLHNQSNNPSVTIHPSSTWVRYKDGRKILVINDMFNEQLRMYRFNPETDGEIAIPSILYVRRNVKPFLFNFDFFKFDDDPEIRALSYCEKRGTQNETSNIGTILDRNFLAYCGVDFGTGKTSITASTTSPFTGGIIELHADSLDGRLIGTCTTANTGGWDKYKKFSSNLTDTITGIHKLFLLMKYPDPSRWPVSQPDYGDWLWTDSNGNGQMDNGEYQASGSDASFNGFWVDKALNLWIYGSDIVMIPCTGIDGAGNPVYSRNTSTSVPAPAAAGVIKRLEYDSDNDIMYIISETSASKFSNWNSNHVTADWVVPILGAQSMSVAGDYLFTINGNSCKVYVYSLADGKFAGRIDPVGPIGLIDIPYGIRAMKRANGEYVVLSEEDSKGKILIFRFSEFIPNTPPTVKVTKPTNNQQITSIASIPIAATAGDADGTVSKVQIFIDGVVVSQTKTYTWLSASVGLHTIYAKAFDNYGDSTTSDTVHVNLLASGVDLQSVQTGLNIYPNPASDKVFLQLSNEVTGYTEIKVLDLRGRILLNQNFVSEDGIYEMDLSNFQNGVYILQLRNGVTTKNLKLIISK